MHEFRLFCFRTLLTQGNGEGPTLYKKTGCLSMSPPPSPKKMVSGWYSPNIQGVVLFNYHYNSTH